MINHEKFKRWQQEAQKRERLKEELSKRPPSPQVGDIFIFAHPEETIGLQWVILRADDKKPHCLLTVPADDAPIVGSTDIELPNSALCSPLTLRCDQGSWIYAEDFNINFRVGVLEEWQRLRALDKIKQISKKKFRIKFQRIITKILKLFHGELPKVVYRLVGDITQLRSSVLHQEMNYDPEYVEWIGQVSQERKAVIQALNVTNKSKFSWKSAIRALISLFKKLKNIFDSLKNTLATFLPVPAGGMVGATAGAAVGAGRGHFFVLPIGWAIAAVLVLAISLFVWRLEPEPPPVPPDNYIIVQIDTTYQTISAQKTDEMEEELRDFKFRWEKTPANASAFSSNGTPSQAAKAFGAGLLTGRETLLGQPTLPSSLLPPPAFENWLKTEWATHFELGRWTFLLWTASQFPEEMPQTFWEEQKKILAHFKAEFEKQPDKTKEMKFQLENLKIEQLLKKLPNPDEPEIYDELGANLEDLISFLAPPPMETAP